MATLDEIFASMPDEAASGTHELLVIDPDTRQIYVPDAEEIFGVEADGNAESKYFQCPRYVGKGIDLAACFLRINYQNANGERDGYLVSDTTVNGEYVYFSWELSKKVTQYKGPVQFVLCASLPGSTKTNDWHTTLAQGKVLEGLEPDAEAVAAASSDVIAQLLALVTIQSDNVEAVGAAQVAKVKAEGIAQVEAVQTAAAQAEADALAEIEAKKQNVLEEIPDDYTAMAAQVDTLTRSTAGAIICEAEGESIQAADASDNYLPGLRIFGKTKQWTTTGAQLIQITLAGPLVAAGLTATPTDDGNLEVNGTHTGDAMWLEFGKATLEAGKTYTLSCPVYFAVHVWDLTNGKEYRTKKLDAESITIQPVETIEVAIVLNDAVTSKTYSGTTVNAVLNEGGTAKAWEPYSGGAASPSPAWPQELVDLPAPVVTVCGKNLLHIPDFDSTTYSNIVARTADTDKLPRGVPIVFDYTYEGDGTPTASTNYTVGLAYEGAGSTVYKHKGEPFVLEDLPILRVTLYGGATNTATTGRFSNIGVWLHEAPAEFEEYTGVAVQIASDLPGIPVASGGNYTDADGQAWICDEVDLGRGVYVQRLGEITLDASKDEYWYTIQATGGTIFAYAIADAMASGSSKKVHCTHFAASVTDAYNKTGNACYFYDKTFRVCHMSIDTLDDFKTWLAENPITVIYPLAAPVEIPLSEAELAAFAALRSVKPTTTILNDSGAHMAVEYVADTKLYIDRKLAELVAALNA